MASFKKKTGDWTRYRQRGRYLEVDFHYSDYGQREIPYMQAMENVRDKVMQALKDAFEKELEYVIFTHGWSTSRPGRTTARSQIRRLMHSKEATPYIIRNQCIQHESVFVAAIRRKSEGGDKDTI